MHLHRAYRGMPINAPSRITHKAGLPCGAAGCTRLSTKRGYCDAHYARARKGRPVDGEIVKRSVHDECDYKAAHLRVVSTFGPAKNHRCVKCEGQAHHWAYDGTDEAQLLGPKDGITYHWYSRYPEFYMPMCLRCHAIKDKGAAARELLTYRIELAQQNGWSIINPIIKGDNA
jgi:hypothetical protein